jgi:nucleotide-binding universal stress UspA family protein
MLDCGMARSARRPVWPTSLWLNTPTAHMTIHPLRSILATSDLTDSSDTGLLTAAALASATGADLHACHCVPKPVFPFWEGLVDDDTRNRWSEEARLDLEWQLRRVLGEEPPIASIDVTIGEPAREINERATETSADMIVLGAHRSRGAFDDLLGTTADRVIRTSAVPCLIANRALTQVLRRVLIPIDFSQPSLRALQVGVDLVAAIRGSDAEEPPTIAEILYVSAFASPSYRPMAVEPRLAEHADTARERLAGTRIKVLPRILSAPLPVDGILRAAEQSETDLIILGTHGYSTLGRALLGSVASGVVRTVPFPILLVPPPARDESQPG